MLELAQCLSESAASPDLHSSPLYPIIIAVVITPAPVRQVSAGGDLCGAEPRVIYPDSGCHSSPGSRLPVFSLVASFASMTEQISVLHAAPVSCDKKQVLLNKADVNNR